MGVEKQLCIGRGLGEKVNCDD